MWSYVEVASVECMPGGFSILVGVDVGICGVWGLTWQEMSLWDEETWGVHACSSSPLFQLLVAITGFRYSSSVYTFSITLPVSLLLHRRLPGEHLYMWFNLFIWLSIATAVSEHGNLVCMSCSTVWPTVPSSRTETLCTCILVPCYSCWN